MTVYVLEPDETAFGLNRQAAIIGFSLKGAEVRRFAPEAFDALPLAPGDTLFGGIDLAHRAMTRLGIAIPALDSIPAPLAPFAGRRLWRESMGAVRQRVARGERLFAKPVPSRHKLFNGQVMESFRDLIPTAGVDDAEPVDCAEIVVFVSEFRTFVRHGEILGLRHYKGDPLLFPNAETVRAAVAAHDPAPAGYALDVGVTSDGRTLVVEVNDGYATGAYGLSPLRYAEIIAARWEELYGAVEGAERIGGE